MASERPAPEYRPDEDESMGAAIIAALSEAKGRDITEESCTTISTRTG